MLPEWLYLTYKGTRDLEGYGHHPGNTFVLVFLSMAAIVGLKEGGLAAAPLAAGFAAIFIIPIWLIGAHGRGQDWANSTRRTRLKTLLQAVVDTHPDLPDSVRFGLRPNPQKNQIYVWQDNPSYVTFDAPFIQAITNACIIHKKPRLPARCEHITLKKRPLSAHEQMSARALVSTIIQ